MARVGHRLLVMVVWLFLAVLWVCLLFLVVFPDHFHLLFLQNDLSKFEQ